MQYWHNTGLYGDIAVVFSEKNAVNMLCFSEIMKFSLLVLVRY